MKGQLPQFPCQVFSWFRGTSCPRSPSLKSESQNQNSSRRLLEIDYRKFFNPDDRFQGSTPSGTGAGVGPQEMCCKVVAAGMVWVGGGGVAYLPGVLLGRGNVLHLCPWGALHARGFLLAQGTLCEALEGDGSSDRGPRIVRAHPLPWQQGIRRWVALSRRVSPGCVRCPRPWSSPRMTLCPTVWGR